MSTILTPEMRKDFVVRALASADRATAGGSPIVPGIATAQACLESRYGTSKLAQNARNLFGVKAHASWNGPTLPMLTAEMQDGELVTVEELWRMYPDWQSCFSDYGTIIATHSWYSGAASAARRGDALGFLAGLVAQWDADGNVVKPGWSTLRTYGDEVLGIAHQWGLV